MRRAWFTALAAALLAGGLPTAVVLVADDQTDSPSRTASVAAGQDDAGETDETDEAGGGKRDDEAGEREGAGPPPWARAHGRHGNGPKGPDAAWKKAWRELTPAQRARKMAGLAKAHADGMQKWARCVAAAGDDPASRRGCEKPLPPGLAKKHSVAP